MDPRSESVYLVDQCEDSPLQLERVWGGINGVLPARSKVIDLVPLEHEPALLVSCESPPAMEVRVTAFYMNFATRDTVRLFDTFRKGIVASDATPALRSNALLFRGEHLLCLKPLQRVGFGATVSLFEHHGGLAVDAPNEPRRHFSALRRPWGLASNEHAFAAVDYKNNAVDLLQVGTFSRTRIPLPAQGKPLALVVPKTQRVLLATSKGLWQIDPAFRVFLEVASFDVEKIRWLRLSNDETQWALFDEVKRSLFVGSFDGPPTVRSYSDSSGFWCSQNFHAVVSQKEKSAFFEYRNEQTGERFEADFLHSSRTFTVTMSKNQEWIASAGEQGDVCVLRRTSAEPVWRFEGKALPQLLWFSSDDRWLHVHGSTGDWLVFDLREGTLAAHRRHEGWWLDTAPDGSRAVFRVDRYKEKKPNLFSLVSTFTGESEFEFALDAHYAAFASNGEGLVLEGKQEKERWLFRVDLHTQKVLPWVRVATVEENVRTIANPFSFDGSLYSVHKDDGQYFWDLNEERPVPRRFLSESTTVSLSRAMGVRVLSGEQRRLLGSLVSSVDSQEVFPFPTHLSREGTWLVVGTQEGQVALFRVRADARKEMHSVFDPLVSSEARTILRCKVCYRPFRMFTGRARRTKDSTEYELWCAECVRSYWRSNTKEEPIFERYIQSFEKLFAQGS